MADANLKDFYGRVYRIQKNHRQGGGFEAAGALGRAYFVGPKARRRTPILGPVLVVAMAVIGLKSAIIAQIGVDTYQQRVAKLETGTSFDKVGAAVMNADPVSMYLSERLREILRH